MLLSGRTALGLLFLGIGALLLRETYAVDVGAFAVPGEMGTMTYPRILLFGWIGLSILYLLNPGKPFNAHDLRASLPGVSKVVASIAVYIILFATVGLPLGTFLFLLLFFIGEGDGGFFTELPGHPAHDPLRPARRGADVAGVREDSGRRRPAALLARPVLTLGRTVCFPISCTAS